MTHITDEAVKAARKHLHNRTPTDEEIRSALHAALPFLPAPEAGIPATELSAAREQAFQEGYRKAIDLTATLIEKNEEWVSFKSFVRGLQPRTEGNLSGLGYVEGIRRISLTTHVDAGKSTERNGWLPIETAPKDGTDILCASFSAAKGYEKRIGHMEVDRYRKEFGGFGKFNGSYWPATHWRPLPAPLASEGAE